MNKPRLNTICMRSLGVGLALVLLTSTVAFAQVAGGGMAGDVDGDQDVDFVDMKLLLNYIINPEGSPPSADVNSDGLLNVFDVNFLAANFGMAQLPSPTPTATPTPLPGSVELFGVHEFEVTNTTSYTNAYDMEEVSLDVVYTDPNGVVTAFWGFHDGDGVGGLDGNIWKARFMPQKVGVYTYTWSFSDDTGSGSGSFSVSDSGRYSGPLVRDGKFFKNARGEAIDACSYGQIVTTTPPGYANSYEYIAQNIDWVQANGMNFIQVAGFGPDRPYGSYASIKPVDFHRYEPMLAAAQEHGIYVYHFRLLNTNDLTSLANNSAAMTNWQKTRIARLGPYWADIGVTPTWEWPEVFSDQFISDIQQQYADLDPFPRPLTAHDATTTTFSPWLGFSSRQMGVANLTSGFSRTVGLHGGVDPAMIDWPIIGTEDLWYQSQFIQNSSDQQKLRQAWWAELLAGVIPNLSTWHWELQQDTPQQMLDEYILACDFVHTQTNYQGWEIRDDLSDNNQITSSSVSNDEYVAYSLDNTITLPVDTYQLTWLDPVSGQTQIQASVTTTGVLTSPITTGDTVLLARPL